MEITRFEIPGLLLFKPKRHGDDRGWFCEAWNAEKYQEAGIKDHFVQDNLARSARNVLRGLHAQQPFAQGKLVQVYDGEVFDVAVDARAGSPTFGKSMGFHLNSERGEQLYVPPGFLHGYLVLSESALFGYKTTEVYAPNCEWSVVWNDSSLGIQWPVEVTPTLSKKDREAPQFKSIDPARFTKYTK